MHENHALRGLRGDPAARAGQRSSPTLRATEIVETHLEVEVLLIGPTLVERRRSSERDGGQDGADGEEGRGEHAEEIVTSREGA